MLHAEICTGLRGLVAAFKLAPLASSVGGAQQRSAYRRLCAILKRASLAPAVRRAEQFVACAFEATGIGAPPPATVCDAVFRRPLRTLATAFFLAPPGTSVGGAILRLWSFYDVIASVHQAHRDAVFFTRARIVALPGQTIVFALARAIARVSVHVEDLVGAEAYARVSVAVFFDARTFQEGAPLKVAEVGQCAGCVYYGIRICVFSHSTGSLSFNHRCTCNSSRAAL